jgi:hypothetical protein
VCPQQVHDGEARRRFEARGGCVQASSEIDLRFDPIEVGETDNQITLI